MATTYTSNYNLGKQEDKNDNFSMDVITENMDKLDAALMTKEDNLLQEQKDKLATTTKTTIAEIIDIIETLNWSATAPFTQNIALSVPGHTITDADYDLNIYRISNATEATDKLEIEAYSYIDKAVISADNTLTLTAYYYKPLTDINVKIEVVKKW